MALLKPRLIFNVARRSLGTSKTLGAYWNKDWAPGPYPKNEEEMAAAAKKYGLLPEEYQPIPNDGDGAGDYPAFKPYSVEGRDMHYPWDFPEYRRNFGEALHEDFNIYTEDRYDVETKLRYSMTTMLACFIGVMGSFYCLFRLGEDMTFFPRMPKHMPGPGVTHYKYK